MAAASGCLAPGGGMTRPRILRTAFSNTSGVLADALRRDSLEADARDLRAVVVAADAVPLESSRAVPEVPGLGGGRRLLEGP